MARLKLEETSYAMTLEELVPAYAKNKTELDFIKKACDEQNTAIKTIMAEQGKDSAEIGDYKVTVSTQTREAMNEEKLIDVLEHSVYHTDDTADAICIATGLGIVKMKPYVDMDALESAIYKGLIPEDVMMRIASCKESKEVVTLRVSKKKAKKEA